MKISAEEKEKTRQRILDAGFRLFSARGIEAVTMPDVAREAGAGRATLYHYFEDKPALVIAIAAKKWGEYLRTYRRPETDDLSAAEHFGIYLDSFVDLYRFHKDLLCFTQYLNVYLRSAHVEGDVVEPFQEVIRELGSYVHEVFQKALADHTLRTDVPEKIMFSTTLHLMLAAVTRYAVGLVYSPEEGYDPEGELLTLRDVLMEKYRG